MNPKYNPAGKSTREMANRRRKTALIIGLVALGIVIILAIFVFNSQALGVSGGALFAIILAVWLIMQLIDVYDRRSTRMEKRASRGAQAEEVVGSMLESLGPDYFVLHDIESPYGNIDHVVIGRLTGVLLIETKSHHGKVDIAGGDLLVNGKPPEKNFIGQVLSNCFWLKERIAEITTVQPWIKPVLVFTNAFVPFGKTIKNVSIINKRYLEGAVKQNPREDATTKRIWEMRSAIAENLSDNSKIQ